jgi:zinc protease
MFLAWQIPGADDPMAPLFDVMALILGQGESSRLVHRLRIEQPLVNGIGTSAFTPQQSGLFCITATFTLEKLASIFSAITEEVVRFLVEGPQQEELDKAITNFESESYYTMETVDGLARKAGHYEFILRDPNYFSTFLERVGETKAADILALARKFLRPENMQVCILAGEGSVEELSGVSDQWRKDFTKALDRGLKLAPEMSRPEEIRSRVNWHGGVTRANHPQNENIIMPLPHGGTAIYRVSKDTASVSLRAGFLGGLRAEGHGPQGLTEMLSRTWDTATQNTSEREIKSRLDQLASSIGSFGGRNTVGLTMDTLRPFTDSMLDMFSAILLQPAFAPEIFNREREVLTTSLKNESDNPARIASYNFLEKLFGDHPYSRRMSGTIESLSQIDSEMVRRFWKSFVNATNGLIVATGDIDVESFHQRITNVFDSLGGGEQFSQSFAHESPADDVQVYSALDKEQTHIILGYKGLVLTDPQRHALHIMEAILAGQGGRLFLELRDKASLAYSVSPMRMEGVDSGYFGAYIGCSPEKSTVAIEMLKLEFKKLCDELVSDKELERAQKYLIGRHDIELQRSSAISGAIMFDFIYGIDAGEAFRFGERVMNVSKQDVQILAQSLFSQHSITSLVGPQSIW